MSENKRDYEIGRGKPPKAGAESFLRAGWVRVDAGDGRG